MIETQIMSNVALEFVSFDDFDTQINGALKVVGSGLEVSRCHLFLDSPDGLTTTNTHEWCAPGIEPQTENLKNILYADIPEWVEYLERGEVQAIKNVTKLPQSLRNILEPQGVYSLIISPILIKGVRKGFVGLNECTRVRTWCFSEVNILKNLASIVAVVYGKKLLVDTLSVTTENYRTLFDTIDDIITIADTAGNIVFANKGAVSKLGYCFEEFIGKPILQLHPADKRKEAELILKSMFGKERDSCPLELEAKDGHIVPVETRVWFGEWNHADCIFGVSKDLSKEQEALQKFERIFRDNPAPMALSKLDADTTFVDVNDAWLRTLGFTKEEVIGASSIKLGLFPDPTIFVSVKEELIATGHISGKELEIL